MICQPLSPQKSIQINSSVQTKNFEKIFEKVVDIPIFLCILQHISNGALENKIQGAFFVYLRVFILITKIKINGALKGDFIMAQSIPEIYGSLVFNDKIMREKLPKDMYKALKKTIENGYTPGT